MTPVMLICLARYTYWEVIIYGEGKYDSSWFMGLSDYHCQSSYNSLAGLFEYSVRKKGAEGIGAPRQITPLNPVQLR